MIKKKLILLSSYLNNFKFWCINISLISLVFFYQMLISNKQRFICPLQVNENFKIETIIIFNENFPNNLISDINKNSTFSKSNLKVFNYFSNFEKINNDIISKKHFLISYKDKQVTDDQIKNNLVFLVKNLNIELLDNNNYLTSLSNTFLRSMYHQRQNNINLKLENLPSFKDYDFIEKHKKIPIFKENVKIEDCTIEKNSKIKLLINSILLILILNITYFFYKLKKKTS